jgi:HlyD family secretion protein
MPNILHIGGNSTAAGFPACIPLGGGNVSSVSNNHFRGAGRSRAVHNAHIERTVRDNLSARAARTDLSTIRRNALAGALATILACAPESSGTLVASGTIEIVQTDIASLVPARIVSLLRNEGDSVRAGDTLVMLTQSTLVSDIEQRQARVSAAEAVLRDLQAGARPAEIDRAQAELRTAEAELERVSKELTRMTALLQAQAISQAQFDAAKAASDAASSRRDAAAEGVKLLQEGVRENRIATARAEVAAARASVATARALSADLVLTAPVSGVVLARYAEAGEVIAAGVPLMTVGDAAHPWVRVFVAAPALASIAVGDEALAELQGVEDQLFGGRVVSIDATAQFTPRVALTESERADLMFGVKVMLSPGTQVLKSGLPVDLHFDTTRTGFPDNFAMGKTVHAAPSASIVR